MPRPLGSSYITIDFDIVLLRFSLVASVNAATIVPQRVI